ALLENLKGRRYDEALKESVLSEAFHQSGYSDCLRYTLESMLEIDPSYAYKVYANSRKIHEKIAKALKKKGYHIDYRYQGELKTYSNILLYGDVEIIVIKKNTSEKPHTDVQTMGMDLMDLLSGDPGFKSVDYGDRTRLRITALKPTCEIDILPSVWVDSAEYVKTKNEIYRGIAEFDFRKKKVKKYLPFLNIARINSRDQHTKGTFKCMSRLLKTLRADSEERIGLRESEINAILYSIPESEMMVEASKHLSLLPKVEAKLDELHMNSNLFNNLRSPSEKDRVFAGRPEQLVEIGKLKTELSKLIEDIKADLSTKDMTIDSEVPYDTSLN
ncbi:MAG: hypothetical protein AAF391_07175, partial [Bacteroidota bacterium]